MTKNEFESKFQSVRAKQFDTISERITKTLESQADENGKLPLDAALAAVLFESAAFSADFLKLVLEETLEFDS